VHSIRVFAKNMGDPYFEPTYHGSRQNGKFQFCVIIHILIPFQFILARGPILLTKNHWMVYKVAF